MDVFRGQVERCAGSVAVVDAVTGGRLTYGELDERSAVVAAGLVARWGVLTDRPVPVLAGRGVDLLVVLLAVVKAGGAYQPVHPDHPLVRQREILAGTDAGVGLLLVDRAHRDHPLTQGRRVLVFGPDGLEDPDPDLDLDLDLDLDNPGGLAGPEGGVGLGGLVVGADQLVYVMSTSGSTGRPKAIGISHASVVDLALDRCWQVSAADRVLFQAPHAFDGSTYEIWAPLLAGGCVVVAGPGPVTARSLRAVIGEHAVSRVSLTAGLFTVLAEDDPACFAGLAEVTTGGDVIAAAAVRAVLDACPGIVVRTTYGPTEATMCLTATGWTAADQVPSPVPLGQPMHNSGLHVLDHHLQPCPVGVLGQLYLSGTGLARGYLADPALTATRFLANPYGPPGSRLYRTGDLARWHRDGSLTFHGRDDDQVKIRGVRVELGDIHTALTAIPGVHQATITITEHNNHRTLTGYYTGTTDPTTIHHHLTHTLPPQLIPTTLTHLTTWPLTPNGKLDHTALPAPDLADSDSGLARSPHEHTLCGLFGTALGIDRLGPEDGFFAHGGNSLLAVRLTNLVNRALGTNITAQAVFAHPTPAALSAHLYRTSPRDGLRQVLTYRSTGTRAPFVLLPAANGLGWCWSALASKLPADHPVHALQDTRLADDHVPARSVKDLAAQYRRLIRELVPTGPVILVGWSFGGTVAQEVAAGLADVTLLVLLDSSPGGLPDPGDADVAGLLATALDGLVVPGTWDRVPPADVLAEHLRRAGSPLAALEEAVVANLVAVCRENRRALSAHLAGPTAAPTLFIDAKPDQARTPASELWRSRGPLEAYQVCFDHLDLLTPDAVPELGAVITRKVSDVSA